MEAWQAIDASAFSCHAWDGEIVVYHRGSGDTHLLNPLASQIFESLMTGPATLAELEEQVARSLDLGIAPELRGDLEDTVQRLREFGLIERRA